jgi:hypothetical protein
LDNQQKKYYLLKAFRNATYNKAFTEGVNLMNAMDDQLPVNDRCTIAIYISRMRDLYTRDHVSTIMDANPLGGKRKDRINVTKHSNKAITKPKWTPRKEDSHLPKKDLSEVVCFGCQKKGHYKNSKECPLFKKKLNNTEGGNGLADEFAKTSLGRSNKGK